MKNWEKKEVVCINAKTKKELKVGDAVKSSRGEEAIILSFNPPHKSSASGRIKTTLGFHYCSVYGARYILASYHEKYWKAVKKLEKKYNDIDLSHETILLMAIDVMNFNETKEETPPKKGGRKPAKEVEQY